MTTKKAAPQQLKDNTSGKKSNRLDLTIQRVPFCQSVDSKMRTLKGRTGITPNILARMGFALSLEDPGIPQDPFEAEEAGRDINRGTLLGENDAAFVALLRTWVVQQGMLDDCSESQFNSLFIAHMNRGFELLSARMRDLPGLGNLLATTTKA